MIVELDNCLPGRREIDRVAGAIRDGRILGYPAETMYGLGGDGGNAAVVAAVRAIKGRRAGKGFILLVDSTGRAEELCGPLPDAARELADRHWPGPLTLVLPAADPGHPAAADGKLAVRLPRSAHLVEWVRLAGRPLLSSSANRAGGAPARTADALARSFGDDLDLIVAGPRFDEETPPSTVVDLTGDRPRLLRAGATDVHLP